MQTLARRRHLEMRRWERDPAGEATVDPDAEHDRVSYVQAGAIIVRIDHGPPVELHAGDSYVVPAGCDCCFEVLEPSTVIEAVAPA